MLRIQYKYMGELGDPAFLFFKKTRWNCTQKFQIGPGEPALIKIIVGIFHGAHDDFRTKKNLKSVVSPSLYKKRVQFHPVFIGDCECSFT